MPCLILRAAVLAATLFSGTYPSAGIADSERSLNGTTIRIQPTKQQGAVAEISFENRAVNSASDDSSFPLDSIGVGVQVDFRWNANAAGDDEIDIRTDAAHIAVPRILVVPEGQSGTAYIYPLESVGF